MVHPSLVAAKYARLGILVVELVVEIVEDRLDERGILLAFALGPDQFPFAQDLIRYVARNTSQPQ